MIQTIWKIKKRQMRKKIRKNDQNVTHTVFLNHITIFLENIRDKKDLDLLFEKAHINTLVTFQKTGIKLKLLNALYKGKHIIANTELIEDTGLENLCNIANTKEEILQKTAQLFKEKFSDLEVEKRAKKLNEFKPETAAKKIVRIIFKQ